MIVNTSSKFKHVIQSMYSISSYALLIMKGLYLDSVIVSEGANTMDIGRTMLLNNLPRHRLDAGEIYSILQLIYVHQNIGHLLFSNKFFYW